MNLKLTPVLRERHVLFGRDLLVSEEQHLPLQERPVDFGVHVRTQWLTHVDTVDLRSERYPYRGELEEVERFRLDAVSKAAKDAGPVVSWILHGAILCLLVRCAPSTRLELSAVTPRCFKPTAQPHPDGSIEIQYASTSSSSSAT